MKRLLRSLLLMVFISLLLCTSNLYATEIKAKNSLYFLGYGGLLTIGYQRLLHDKVGVNIQLASIALLHEDLRDAFTIPAVVSFYPYGNKHRWFVDLGMSYISKGKNNPSTH